MTEQTTIRQTGDHAGYPESELHQMDLVEQLIDATENHVNAAAALDEARTETERAKWQTRFDESGKRQLDIARAIRARLGEQR